MWRRWLCRLLRFLSSVSPGVLQNLTWRLRVHRRRSFVKVFVSCRASVPSLKFVKEKPFVSRQSSTVVADPRGNETSSEVVTADLLTCYLRVAEASLLHLFGPLHLNRPMHHPTGAQFSISLSSSLGRSRSQPAWWRGQRRSSAFLQPAERGRQRRCLHLEGSSARLRWSKCGWVQRRCR